MTVKFIAVGKIDAEYLREAVSIYKNRLMHYVPFELICIPDIKNAGKLSENQLKIREGENILETLKTGDEIILLDEKGETFSSPEFATFISKKINSGTKRLVFIAGGAYGFSEEMYKKASTTVSLSRMTFNHQMVRLVFIEQLYRAFTIIRGEPYHHK
ncbi:MAG: 23S rRNA (pseudouridine(1915)-N(3))-methyltransferase RlmH [Prevotellaceae bacterium]|jgi:23S rRNA (pseudouridine1915-N3)-methyltransferase|nr:23S rRNA (pseudouridine(1915)-N(3))-methyltransferase RlmH [Prevotellaceae bacterium]